MNRLVRLLPAVTLVSVLVVTATSEFRLAVDVLALPVWVAWGVPAAIDSYVVAAVRSRRDVLPAMAVMALSLFAAAGSHLVSVRTGGRLPVEITGPVSAVVLSVLVLVAWRVHVLIDRLAEPQVMTSHSLHELPGHAEHTKLEADLPQAIVPQRIPAETTPVTLGADLHQAFVPEHLRAVAAEDPHPAVTAHVPPGTQDGTPGTPPGTTRERIAALRRAEPGITQAELSRRVGVSTSTVGRHVTALSRP